MLTILDSKSPQSRGLLVDQPLTPLPFELSLILLTVLVHRDDIAYSHF